MAPANLQQPIDDRDAAEGTGGLSEEHSRIGRLPMAQQQRMEEPPQSAERQQHDRSERLTVGDTETIEQRERDHRS